MHQSKRRAPPPPLNLRPVRPQPAFGCLQRPPATPPPRTPLPALPLPTPPHTPCSPCLCLPDRCTSSASCALPLSLASPTYLEPRDPRRQRRAAREPLVPLPTTFQGDDDGLHPFTRLEDDTLCSPTVSTCSTATAAGVDARIADLEAQVRALQERLEPRREPELRPTKSMTFFRRIMRQEDPEAKELIAFVDAKRNGRTAREKGKEGPTLGRAGTSAIDLSHLEVKDKERWWWNTWRRAKS